MKLYEITEENRLAIDTMLGMDDITEETIADTLGGIADDFKDKAKQIAAYYLNLEAEAVAMKGAESKISKRRKSIESKSVWLKEYLLCNMVKMDILKIESPELSLKIRNNPVSVQIQDEGLIPEEFKLRTETVKVDKIAVKQSGGCAGVELVKSKSLSIK